MPDDPMTTTNSARAAAERIATRYCEWDGRASGDGWVKFKDFPESFQDATIQDITAIIEEKTKVGVKEEVCKMIIRYESLMISYDAGYGVLVNIIAKAKHALGDKPVEESESSFRLTSKEEAIREALLILDDDVDFTDVVKATKILRAALASPE